MNSVETDIYMEFMDVTSKVMLIKALNCNSYWDSAKELFGYL